MAALAEEAPVHIGTIDESGVALAAIKGLYEQLQVKDQEIASLREELNAIKAALSEAHSSRS